MVLEFYGTSMVPAAELVRKIVNLRDKIRNQGGDVHVSALGSPTPSMCRP